MTFDTFTLALLVVLPISLSLGVLFLTKKRLGNVVAFILGLATLVGSAWAVLYLGLGG